MTFITRMAELQFPEQAAVLLENYRAIQSLVFEATPQTERWNEWLKSRGLPAQTHQEVVETDTTMLDLLMQTADWQAEDVSDDDLIRASKAIWTPAQLAAASAFLLSVLRIEPDERRVDFDDLVAETKATKCGAAVFRSRVRRTLLGYGSSKLGEHKIQGERSRMKEIFDSKQMLAKHRRLVGMANELFYRYECAEAKEEEGEEEEEEKEEKKEKEKGGGAEKRGAWFHIAFLTLAAKLAGADGLRYIEYLTHRAARKSASSGSHPIHTHLSQALLGGATPEQEQRVFDHEKQILRKIKWNTDSVPFLCTPATP